MTTDNPIDIILDMVVGTDAKSNFSSNVRETAETKDLVPISRKKSSNLKTKASGSNFNFKRTIWNRFFGSKKQNSKEDIDFITGASLDHSAKVYEALKKCIPKYKYYFSETKIGRELFGFDPDLAEFKKDINLIDNIEGNNTNKKESLELFFNYVMNITNEFTEEDILELETRILKIIKCIKGKRDLKQHLRRYTAAMNFKEPLFFNDIRCNI